MGIFKAYDIRGLVPGELDADLARKIGHAFARTLVHGHSGNVFSVERDGTLCWAQ